MGYLKITIANFFHPATPVRQISKCASRTITGRIFAASRFTYGGGISDPAPEGGYKYATRDIRLGFRFSLVGYFKKARYSKGLRGDREKLVYRCNQNVGCKSTSHYLQLL